MCVCLYVCMYGQRFQQSMDQSGKIVNDPARGQLNRGNQFFPVLVRAREFGLARQVRQPRPASACEFSTLRLNIVLTHGIPPDFRGGVRVFLSPTATGSVPRFSGHTITYRWRSLPRGRRHRASSSQGSSSNGCCLCSYHHGPIIAHLSFPAPTIGM